jgi:uncharacterized protein YycO
MNARATYPPPRVDEATVKRFAPGQDATPTEFLPGDFILTHGKSVFSYLIRFGQGLRFWGRDRQYTWWNHAAMIISGDGNLIEALGAGVECTNIVKYRATEYHLVHLSSAVANEHDRQQSVKFAEWTLGQRYGWATIVSIAISLLFGGKFTFGFDGQFICSGLVARALERTNAIFDRSPSHIMPADLAKYFHVTPPPKGTNRGEPQGPGKTRSPAPTTTRTEAKSVTRLS